MGDCDSFGIWKLELSECESLQTSTAGHAGYETLRFVDSMGNSREKTHPTGSFTLSQVTTIGGIQGYSKMPPNEVFFRLVMLQVQKHTW